jgi:hypothetical protein
MESWFRGKDEGSEDSPGNRDPIVDDPACEGLEISKVPFSELIKVFPDTTQVIFFFGWCENAFETEHLSV